jgi:ATP-binding cassette subfamily B protein
VKAFAQEKREAQRFADANRANLAVNDRLNRTWSLFSPTVTLLTDVGLLIVWAFGIWQVSKGEITVGVLTAFIAYIGRFYGRLESMSRIVSITQKAAAGAKRIFDILDHNSSVPEPSQPVKIDKPEGHITLKNVGFRYGSRAVIRGLDLDIRPGEMIGLVGHSGSGKSTLVNLICRFYDPTTGRVTIDGVPLTEMALADLRGRIAMVTQQTELFNESVHYNIKYGRWDATDEEIEEAARKAHAHDFIADFPDGYRTMVGPGGFRLSGGQRQRIALARAFLRDAEILVLDEATSQIDVESERLIHEALARYVENRTVIMITHRASTLALADSILEVEHGRVTKRVAPRHHAA